MKLTMMRQRGKLRCVASRWHGRNGDEGRGIDYLDKQGVIRALCGRV
jgi:hypothetical protein